MSRVSSTFTVTRFEPQPHEAAVTTALESFTGSIDGRTGTGSIVVDPDGTHHLHLDIDQPTT